MPDKNYEIVYEDEYDAWFRALSMDEKESVRVYVALLQQFGVTLDYPYSSKVNGSEYKKMRELRIQHEGRPYRVFYAFNRRRQYVLLTGDEKTGENDRQFYKRMVSKADAIYTRHLMALDKEDKENEKMG